ncbi:hypothetical protein BSKO_08333 [Bryopsis sp. KO-2023]|nr:hypothetical protein BSKO_08333 [Bryopsis sp. KO-2023]
MLESPRSARCLRPLNVACLVLFLQVALGGVLLMKGCFLSSSCPVSPSDAPHTNRQLKQATGERNCLRSSVLPDNVLRIPMEALEGMNDTGNSMGYLANYRVAFKRLKKRRFIEEDAINEMELQASIEHPSIARFLAAVINDTDTQDDLTPIGFIMEYFEGEQLETVLAEKSHRHRPPLPLAIRYKIAMDVAHSLAHLHSKGIIHFDVKPDQMLVRGFPPSQAPVSARLIDFGFALRESSSGYVNGELDNSTRWRGMYRYLAPEMIKDDRNVTKQIDIFSFGVVLWEMYTRTVPYHEYGKDDLLDRVMNDGPFPLELPEEAEPEWKSLVQECMQVDPLKRPSFVNLTIRFEEALDALLLRETGGKNNSENVYVQPGFDENESDVEEREVECHKTDRRLLVHRDRMMGLHPINISRLELGDRVGKGGYGKVFLAGYTVRAKLYEDVNPDAMRQVYMLSVVRHPSILRLIGAVVDASMGAGAQFIPDVYGVVTEHFGPHVSTLRDFGAGAHLSSEVVRQIGIQLAGGLASIHSHDFVLLGLNPDDIVVEATPTAEINAKISDVSLVQCVGAPLTNDIQNAIKHRGRSFVAPEVFDGVLSDKADVFSLGRVMAHLCGGSLKGSQCKLDLWNMISECVVLNPEDRLTALDIQNRLIGLGNLSEPVTPVT